MTYFFTYGSGNDMPFRGGWTEILAQDKETAVSLFRKLHPDKYEGVINCCSVMDEYEFMSSSMWIHGNLGHREWEKMTYWKLKK